MFSMKSLMRPTAAMLCATMITYWPLTLSLRAEPPQPAEPGEPPAVSPEELIANQAEVFTKLFNEPYNPEEWTYPLHEQVKDTGIYKGENHLGQEFQLDVKVAAPVDLKTLDGIADDERAWAIRHGFEYTGVIGTLSTDMAEVPVIGLAVFQSNPTIPFDSRFILVNTADASHAIFNTAAFDPGGCSIGWFDIEIPIYCLDPDCIEDCWEEFDECLDDALDDFNEAVDAANAAFDIAANLAQANRDAAVNSANAAYNAAKNAADNQLAIALAACTATITAAHIGCAFVTALFWWTGGAATLACVVAAQVAFAACVATAMAIHSSNVNAAAATRDAAIAAANASYQAEIDAANATRNLALQQAWNDYEDALDDCLDEFEDCIEDCEWIICGVIVIRFPFVYCWFW
jgi:hypothetical protein